MRTLFIGPPCAERKYFIFCDCCYGSSLVTTLTNRLSVGRRTSSFAMLLLDEKAYKALAENSKVLYLLQWLQNLPKVIKDTERVSLNSVLHLEKGLAMKTCFLRCNCF